MTIIVTGAAGFIGSNLVKGLNDRGITDIIAVDNLKNPAKFKNLIDCEIADYFDKNEFIEMIESGSFKGGATAILHQGACSDTMESDGRYMMENNYRYSMTLLDHCQRQGISFIYASSASVYGSGEVFQESREFEGPLNVYGYSKFLFDQIVRKRMAKKSAQIAGFRYFNVYGPRETHKGRMASVSFHFFNQFREKGSVKLFEGCAGYGNGEQRRDFVSVEDVVKVNLHFLDHPEISGIYNVGTGASEPFNNVAVATINACLKQEGKAPLTLAEMKENGMIEYIPFPEGLKKQYQSFTEADIGSLRRAGYAAPFYSVEEGVSRYVGHLLRNC
ncbi:MAG: ADP-glyceromanno-heptose 6-epimerase [Burkholderiales bacterium]|nr:ADP-glyceromanno-heptose 6-epimerase [Burkholderiales bacterium]